MKRYIEIRKGLSGESTITSVEEFGNVLKQSIQDAPESEWYRSLFCYPEGIIKHYEEKGGVKSFKERVEAGYLVFDIDDKDLEKAQQDTREVLRRLLRLSKMKIEEFSRCVELYFSGNKGFHVILKTEQRFSPEEMKLICKKIAEGVGSVDKKIYNTTRIFRLENTINDKSGLYKIQLNPTELRNLTVDQIKEKAQKPSKIEKYPDTFNFSDYEDYLEPVKQQPVVVDVKEIDGIRGLEDIDFKKCPKNTPRCVYAISKGVMVPGNGERHEIYLALARFYKNQGFDKDQTHNLLKATSRLNHKLYPESDKYEPGTIWNEVIVSVFDTDDHFNLGGWGINPENDETFKRYCDALEGNVGRKCCMHHAKAQQKDTYEIEELVEDYIEFAENYETSIIKTGVSFIDEEMEIMRGTVTLLVGAAGSGKTTFALKLLQNASEAGITSVMFSMDMNKRPLFEKLFLKHTEYSKMDIREMARNDKERYRKELNEVLGKFYKNVIFVTKGTMTPDQMKEKVEEISNAKGRVGLVLVDYAGRVTSNKNSDGGSYSDSKACALRAPEIASDTDSAWVYLCQVGRNAGDSHIPLRTKRAAKGAGDWEEAAQNVITIWRPFADLHGVVYEDDDLEENITFNDNVMRCYTAKNRMGKSREVILKFTGQDVLEITPGQTDHYMENRQNHEKYAWKYKSGAKSFGA